MANVRPPPKILLVHNGMPIEAQVAHLLGAGLNVAHSHADAALAKAIEFLPDIIVLDFEVDGDLAAQLKHHHATMHIPVIALVELANNR